MGGQVVVLMLAIGAVVFWYLVVGREEDARTHESEAPSDEEVHEDPCSRW